MEEIEQRKIDLQNIMFAIERAPMLKADLVNVEKSFERVMKILLPPVEQPDEVK